MRLRPDSPAVRVPRAPLIAGWIAGHAGAAELAARRIPSVPGTGGPIPAACGRRLRSRAPTLAVPVLTPLRSGGVVAGVRDRRVGVGLLRLGELWLRLGGVERATRRAPGDEDQHQRLHDPTVAGHRWSQRWKTRC